MAGRTLPVAVAVLATVLLVFGCTTAPIPSASLAPASTPRPSAIPAASPTLLPTASPESTLWCSDAVGIVDHTGQLRRCQDLGPAGATGVAPHLANHGADLSGLRVWWSTSGCVSVWHLDLHETPYGVTLEILDNGQDACSLEAVGHAIDLELHPPVFAGHLALLHNGNLIVTLPPAPTPHPSTFPGTPSSIQFGHWELAHGENPTRDATTIHAVVYENACASGQSPEGRILEPFLAYDERYVSIAFAVWSLPGSQACVPGPGVPVTVELREPLGRRHLRDSGCGIEGFAVSGAITH